MEILKSELYYYHISHPESLYTLAGSMLLAFPVNWIILNFDYIIMLAIFVNYKYEYLLCLVHSMRKLI
jgi:hypothetical protein